MDDSSYYEIDEDVDWLIIENLLLNKKKNGIGTIC